MSRKLAKLSHTAEEWNIISKLAEEKSPRNGGIPQFITMELTRKLKSGGVCLPCSYENVQKIAKNYVIPVDLLPLIECYCIRYKVDPATLISRLVIEPYLLDK